MKNEDFLPLNKMTKEETQMALYLRTSAIVRFDIECNNIILEKYNKNTNMQITYLIVLLQHKIFNEIKELQIEGHIANKKDFIHLINQHIFKICYDYLNIISIKKIGIGFTDLQTFTKYQSYQEFLDKLNHLTFVAAAEIYYKINKDCTKTESSQTLNLELLDSYLESDLSLIKDNLFDLIQNIDLSNNILKTHKNKRTCTSYILFFILIIIIILIVSYSK